MKLQSLFATTSLLLLTASTAFAQDSKLTTQYPSLFRPGHITSFSVKDENQLPQDYLSFTKLVPSLFPSDGEDSEEVSTYASPTEDVCAKAPSSTRACVHARYFEEMQKPQKTAPPFVQLSNPSELMLAPGNYTNMNLHRDIYSAEFSPDFDRNTRVTTAMIYKLKSSTHRLAFVFVPTTNRIVMSSNVRVIDDNCRFVGTPEQYLMENTCTGR